MTILSCFAGDGSHVMWKIGASIVCIIFFLICLLGVVPALRFWPEFRMQPLFSIITRASFVITALFKALGHLSGILIGSYPGPGSDYKRMSISGLMVLELPCYFVVLSYSFVLMSWLSVCLKALPMKYAKLFNWTKIGLIVYNIIVFFLFFISILIEANPENVSPRTLDVFSGVVAVVRDFFLCLLFIGFILVLKLGLQEDAYAEESVDEKRLMISTGVLAVLLLLRGVVALIQGLSVIGKESECSGGFFVCFLITELLFEALPLGVLLYVSNDALEQQGRLGLDSTAIGASLASNEN